MIIFCPNCAVEFDKEFNQKIKLAQGVSACSNCGARFFILETTRPTKDEMDKRKTRR